MTRTAEYRCWTQVRQAAAVCTRQCSASMVLDALDRRGHTDTVYSWIGETQIRGVWGAQQLYCVSMFDHQVDDALQNNLTGQPL